MQVSLDPGMAKGLLLHIPGRRLIVEYSMLMSADPGMADPRKVIVALHILAWPLSTILNC